MTTNDEKKNRNGNGTLALFCLCSVNHFDLEGIIFALFDMEEDYKDWKIYTINQDGWMIKGSSQNFLFNKKHSKHSRNT